VIDKDLIVMSYDLIRYLICHVNLVLDLDVIKLIKILRCNNLLIF